MQEGYKWVREGKVSILAPDPGLYRRSDGVYEPAWAPVFYNPRMVFNRDMAILVARALFREGEWVFAEPLAGTGVRSVRLLVEAGARYGVLNDLDPRACRLAARNLLANGLGGRAHVYCMEASLLLRMLAWSGMRFDYVDIDPFGSPMPFVEAALLSLRRGGILAVTATDTAPLSGTHPQACLRRYQARPLRTGPSRETALRILVGAIIRRAAEHDLEAEPILAYYADYYLRAYFRVSRSARGVDELLGSMGYLECRDAACIDARLVDGYPGPRHPLPDTYAGPLWAGALCSPGLVERVKQELGAAGYIETAARARRLLDALSVECAVNRPYIRVDRLCGAMGVSMPSPRKLAARLAEEGFRAVVSSFDPRAISTDAPLDEVRRIVLELTR